MVKPTLKPESEKEKKEEDLKDDKLKEWGILPATVVIDESEKEKDKKDAEAAITEFDNLETDVDNGSRPMIVKCCACFAVFTILLIVTCTVGSFLYFHYGSSEHKWNGWCSVKYGDGDNDSGESHERGHHHGHGDDRQHGHPYGNDALYPPTGPPGGRTCNQHNQVDIDNQLERVDRPQEEDCERITILHDYNVNISAYRLWKSEICYITWIEDEVLMNPAEFWTNMQDPQYLNQWFDELTMTYRTVLPAIPTPLHEQENGKFGEYLDGPQEFLCQGATTYWIEKIPEEDLAEFLELVDQIMQELMALAAAYDADMADGDQRPQHHQGGHHQGGHHGMPFPGGEDAQDGIPWEDFMPMRNPMNDEDMPMEWPFGHHGMRDDDDDEEPHGLRQRRSGGRLDKAFKKKAKEAKDCVEQNNQCMKEIGINKVLCLKAIPPCIIKRLPEEKLMELAKKSARDQ